MPSLRSAELIANLSFHEIPGIKTVRIRRTSFVLRSATAFGNVSFRRTDVPLLPPVRWLCDLGEGG